MKLLIVAVSLGICTILATRYSSELPEQWRFSAGLVWGMAMIVISTILSGCVSLSIG